MVGKNERGTAVAIDANVSLDHVHKNRHRIKFNVTVNRRDAIQCEWEKA